MKNLTDSPEQLAAVRSSDLLGVHARYKEAAERLAEATKKAFPVGSVIAVTMGRYRIVGEVESAGGSWVRIRNLSTGKLRHFSATYSGHAPEMLTPNEGVERRRKRLLNYE